MLNFEGSPSDTALLRSSRLPGALRAAPGPAAAAKHKALLREPGTKVARLALWQSPSKRCPSSKGCVSSSAFRNLQHLPDFLKSDRTTAAGRPHLDTAPHPRASLSPSLIRSFRLPGGALPASGDYSPFLTSITRRSSFSPSPSPVKSITERGACGAVLRPLGEQPRLGPSRSVATEAEKSVFPPPAGSGRGRAGFAAPNLVSLTERRPPKPPPRRGRAGSGFPRARKGWAALPGH